jgi:hypothetical protein
MIIDPTPVMVNLLPRASASRTRLRKVFIHNQRHPYLLRAIPQGRTSSPMLAYLAFAYDIWVVYDTVLIKWLLFLGALQAT